jgi:dethiobiotin synthetase/adenosylmethionine--8-amino-7-oxononanoate aminotransferase
MFSPLQAAAAAHATSAAAAATYLQDSATLFAYSDPVSPHLAAAQEGRVIADADIVAGLAQQLQRFTAAVQAQGSAQGLTVVETAGGVTSPGPSGNLQVRRLAAAAMYVTIK